MSFKHLFLSSGTKALIFGLMLVVVALFIFTAACSTDDEVQNTAEVSTHDDTSHGTHDHGASTVTNTPMQVSINVARDAVSGVNVCLSVTGFNFTPQEINGPHVDGNGHAHLYIDEVKWGRMYGPCVHVSNLKPGSHHFRATLNSNNHAEYVYGGSAVEATTVFSLS